MWLVPMYIKQKKKARIQYAIFIQSVTESMVLTIRMNLATIGLRIKTYLAEAIK